MREVELSETFHVGGFVLAIPHIFRALFRQRCLQLRSAVVCSAWKTLRRSVKKLRSAVTLVGDFRETEFIGGVRRYEFSGGVVCTPPFFPTPSKISTENASISKSIRMSPGEESEESVNNSVRSGGPIFPLLKTKYFPVESDEFSENFEALSPPKISPEWEIINIFLIFSTSFSGSMIRQQSTTLVRRSLKQSNAKGAVVQLSFIQEKWEIISGAEKPNPEMLRMFRSRRKAHFPFASDNRAPSLPARKFRNNRITSALSK